jgi:hypothetical protein
MVSVDYTDRLVAALAHLFRLGNGDSSCKQTGLDSHGEDIQ